MSNLSAIKPLLPGLRKSQQTVLTPYLKAGTNVSALMDALAESAQKFLEKKHAHGGLVTLKAAQAAILAPHMTVGTKAEDVVLVLEDAMILYISEQHVGTQKA